MKTIIFDMDGTLLSTEAMYMQSLIQTFKDRGIEKSYEEVYKVFGLPSLDSLIKLEAPEPEKMQLEWQNHYPDFWYEVKVFPGINKMLSGLKVNDFTLGIVTSNTKEEFMENTSQFDFPKYFEDFVFAGETPKMKPAADPILKSLNDLQAVPQSSMYIGDSIHDMQAAHNAGIKFGMAAWGVRDRKVFDNQADYIFEEPQELYDFVINDK
ncbi:HAD family hydrolase [Weissella bombi]|uniref:Haloacid dehalogenase superfamily, subfamily IA, variant 1 with third motif having Dx(3-4)D or Dx(3-4)E n=1 Tax=Weissella bombi TaxID=1505725 RepID=A0A1C3YNN0_9LACO|nr:HAD family hydrolase [Weissella bombi]SCB71673.1 haloacid dehalogenase superfamily, subfamily IA, variant 1 with third motif having Dx(3-4)D or Dx(3-4)E [Weissella bombi]